MDHSSFRWSCHGLAETDGSPTRVLGEPAIFGLTERQGVRILRELRSPPKLGGFLWGYNGGGPARAAAAILADALLAGDHHGRAVTGLRVDFMRDVVPQFDREWRRRRSTVLRWVRGWDADKGVADPPAAAVGLPPASPYEYERGLTDPPGAR